MAAEAQALAVQTNVVGLFRRDMAEAIGRSDAPPLAETLANPNAVILALIRGNRELARREEAA